MKKKTESFIQNIECAGRNKRYFGGSILLVNGVRKHNIISAVLDTPSYMLLVRYQDVKKNQMSL